MKLTRPGVLKKFLLILGTVLCILHIPVYLFTKQSFTNNEKVIKKYEKRYGNRVAPLLNDWINLINTTTRKMNWVH